MVDGAASDEAWDKRDRALLEAYQLLEDERCSECGHPIWICRSENENLAFPIEKSVCHAKRSFEEVTTDMSNFKNAKERNEAKRKFGLIQYPVAAMLDDSPLPTRREFYDAQQTDKL